MSRRTNRSLAKLIYSSAFLALAYLMPYLTQLSELGSKLLPMHIPVLLCGFICGPFWGATVGAAAPLMRCMILGRPVFMYDALTMAFELATYAFVAGLLYKKLPKNILMFFVSLITAMVCGRLVWGGVMFVLIATGFVADLQIGFSLIWSHTVLQGIPGITLQLILVPLVVDVLKKNRLMLN